VKADPEALAGWTAASHELALSKSFPGGDGGDFFELTTTRNRGRLQASDAAASDVTAVEYDVCIKPLMGWGGSRFERQYSTAGWLAALPIFEPGYQIIMSHGLASGSIVVDGKTVEFKDAAAYAGTKTNADVSLGVHSISLEWTPIGPHRLDPLTLNPFGVLASPYTSILRGARGEG
jgi:hypothetical protein